ncbi:MAG: DEAD/DEAH box helicase, partial [Planctomycetota bacterium]|nr:DEAD/DEAH box helicase [Planctomycetota bacterium]
MNTKESLPVMEHLDALLSALGKDKTVILKAPPGAGKTTMVPPAILDSGVHGKNQILVVQPRRLAAIATAQRIAELRGTLLGDQIGYHVRFDSRQSSKTELLTLTTGLLLRRLIRDPLLERVDCVILDEFHERSIEMDLALGMIQQIRTAFRPELKLVIMSATLDAGPLTEFIKDSVRIQSSGRAYPVKIQYEQDLNRGPIENRIASSLDQLLIETRGHILIFLP